MEVDDGSQIARLMDLFTKPVIQSPEFPEISRRNSEVKNTEGGLATMCEVMDKYMNEAKEAGRAEERRQAICLLYSKGFGVTQILDLGYTEKEIAEAIAD